MMPQNSQLVQNKISGLSVAWARGKWEELDDGNMGYIFPESDGFEIRLNPHEMLKLGIDEEALYDCIAQVEELYGSPRDHRLSFGLLPDSGYSNIGTTVRSRLNDDLICVFTPTSQEDRSYDGYFEWYYQEPMGVDDLPTYMARFDLATDSQTSNMIDSPVMPSYGEACERSEGVLDEVTRERFVREVFNFHKTQSRGYRNRIEEEWLPVWKRVLGQ